MAVVVKDIETENWKSAAEHRTPGISQRNLFDRGGEGRSFACHISRFADQFRSPWHRHNFDQIRIGLIGETRYGPRDRLPPRTIGYFPEGTGYGPQSVDAPPSVQLIMQFDGNSGCGYLDLESLDRGTSELRALGTFASGYYTRHGEEKKTDAYQAAWERIRGRPMIYPEPRFNDAIYMNPDSFAWQRCDAGIARKTLGIFGENGTTIRMTRLDAGASMRFTSPKRTTVLFVLNGRIACQGSEIGEWSAILIEDDESADVSGVAETSELVEILLPVAS